MTSKSPQSGSSRASLIVAGFSFLLSSTLAAVVPLGDLTPGVPGITAGARAIFALPADLDSPDTGDISIARYQVLSSYNFPAGPGGFLTLTGIYEYADYNWSDSELFGNTNSLTFSGVGLRQIADSDWGIFGFGQATWAAESGAQLGRGFSSTLIVGPSYSFTPRFTLVVGALISLQPERSTRIFPVAGLNWRIDEQWSLRTLNGVILTYSPDPRFQFDFSAEYRTRGIRLRNQLMPDGSMDRPAVGEREIVAGIGAAWRITESLSLRGTAEYLFERKWTFRSDESRYKTVTAENTPQLSLRFDYAF